MTRRYGRAARNERVNDYVPDVRFKRTSVLSTIRIDGTQIPFVFSGTLNGKLFKEYIDKLLAPSLFGGDILVLDNSSVHRSNGVLSSLKSKGVEIMFLPPYSPDLNPIEMMWSKMKNKLRKLKARKPEMLVDALNVALNCVSCEDIKNWFKHDGYALQ